MRATFLTLVSVFFGLTSWSQTVGNGITVTNFEIAGGQLLFDPTTVGTQASHDLLITNLVGVTQQIVFNGLSAPYSLSQDTIYLSAQQAQVVTLFFDPETVGTFNDELFFAGSIFGSGSLIVSGEGTQIDIETNSDFLQFDATAIGTFSTATLTITNAGSGSMLISGFDFSDDQYSVEETELTIAEGESYDLVVTYTPIFAGGSNETLTILSNDPNEPELVVDLIATGISEVSGEICGTWSLVNSPYILIDNVTIPDGCSLNIEAGVVVQGNGYDIIANGPLSLLGEEGSRIRLENLDVDMELNGGSSIAFKHANVESINVNVNGLPFDFNWNASSIGADGWYNSGGSGGSAYYDNNRVRSEYWANNAWRECFFYSPSRTFNGSLGQISFDREIQDYSGTGNDGVSEYVYFQVNRDGNGWEPIYQDFYIGSQPNQSFSFDLDSLNVESTVQFRFFIRFYSGYRLWIDNFEMDSDGNDYAQFDIDHADFSKDFYMTGRGLQLAADSMRTYYTNWNQSYSEYDIQKWEVEGHSERDEGAYFAGGINTYDMAHITLNDEEWSNEQGLEFADIDGSQFAFDSCDFNGFTHGLYLHSSDYCDFQLNEINANDNSSHALYFTGITYSDFDMSGIRSMNNTGRGLQIDGSNNSADLRYSILADNNNWGFGFGCTTNATEKDSLSVSNCGFFRNNGYGLQTNCQAEFEHLTVLDNTSYGIHIDAAFFGMSQILSSSTLWGNGSSSSWDQLYITNNFINVAHTNLMGGSAGLAGGSWDLDDSFISDFPYFEDQWGHMEPISPGVDGGKPWEIDAHMPMGLGGVRADMGMYGGPNNQYWGGGIISDGSSSLDGVVDIPQDQGNMLGLTFSASFWDNNTAIDPVTNYSIWRHLDASGSGIGSIDEGNWELVGEVPAQGFAAYGYQAPTLGNTNQFGEFNSCYTVIAETAIDQLYWQSNVMCGQSVDNLAPNATDVVAGMIESDLAQVSWFEPAEDDYAYTEVTSDHGFSAEIFGDTLVVDMTVSEGEDYTYYVQHFDVNGNGSEISTASLGAEVLLDIIPLHAGWNLISLDREPYDMDPAAVFSELEPGNLEFVTGFEGGATMYDPNGLDFLNTLTAIEGGRGYWVKVAQDDELQVSGSILSEAYQTPLVDGWNLVGFTGDVRDVEDYFYDELANDQLVYVTGFNQGVSIYNPNGLPFLNTLTQLENGFGYWVKAALQGGLVEGNTKSMTSVHDFLHGVTHAELAGQTIDVLTESGDVIAELLIEEQGVIRTHVLYGADVADDQASAYAGQMLTFRWNGIESDAHVVFDGNRSLHQVDLNFGLQALSAFPTPATDVVTVLSSEFKPERFEVLDATGRVIAEGSWNSTALTLDVNAWTAGCYTLRAFDGFGAQAMQTIVVGR
ncbi:MAG: choice-of-anchor D domain-containing protein [Bacteroidetes bacterium]|nr:choice-of-anchor D domain-containing protein [Bacteroidota bacterium]